MSSCDDYSANLTHFFNITKSFEKNTPISKDYKGLKSSKEKRKVSRAKEEYKKQKKSSQPFQQKCEYNQSIR